MHASEFLVAWSSSKVVHEINYREEQQDSNDHKEPSSSPWWTSSRWIKLPKTMGLVRQAKSIEYFGTHLDHREKISCGVFLLYLLSSRSALLPTGPSLNKGLVSILRIECGLSGRNTFSEMLVRCSPDDNAWAATARAADPLSATFSCDCDEGFGGNSFSSEN